jgi:N-acetylglucosamine-6-sulfatase
MRSLLTFGLVALALLFMSPAAGSANSPSSSCTFVLGFELLAQQIPEIVGECTVDETHNAVNGDGLQTTTRGLLVWRKADNWTAFTDGATTWINGPMGMQSRPNDQRFAWEHRPPNVILIVTDDQRWDTVEWMPTLASLAAQNFTNGYVTTPLCCPSRASILTGQYAHNHGVLTNRADQHGGFSFFRDEDTLATRLAAAGYRTALLGKYLNEYNSPTYIPPGWSDWFAFSGGNAYSRFKINANGERRHFAKDEYSTDVLMHQAAELIRSSGEQPFFLFIAPVAPHEPAIPAPRHADVALDLDPWRPPNYDLVDTSANPRWVAAKGPIDYFKKYKIDRLREQQIRTLLSIDEGIATIVQTLRETRQLDNTAIIYLSDNGYAWGEHRLEGKSCPYQECIRVPFLISYPPLTPMRVDDSRIALNIDLAPTILDLAGLTAAPLADGMSLLPLLAGTASTWRSEFLVEGWKVGTREPPPFAGVVSEDWSYVEYQTGEREMYNLQADPYELRNLAAWPEHATQRELLAVRLAAHRDAPANTIVAAETPASQDP